MEGEEVVEVVEGNRSAGRMVRVREVLRGLNFSKLPVFTCVCSVFIIPLFDRCLTCCEETKAPAAERREERGERKEPSERLLLLRRSEESIDPCAAECLFNHLRCYEVK